MPVPSRFRCTTANAWWTVSVTPSRMAVPSPRMATTVRSAAAPDASDPVRLAAWLAEEIDAAALVLAGAAGAPAPGAGVRRVGAARPQDLAALAEEVGR